jgi:hypothetical protein
VARIPTEMVSLCTSKPRWTGQDAQHWPRPAPPYVGSVRQGWMIHADADGAGRFMLTSGSGERLQETALLRAHPVDGQDARQAARATGWSGPWVGAVG